MNWYYESGGQQQGPVADSELDRLLAEGKVTQDTLIWREGMAGWTPLRAARPAAPSSPPAGAPGAPVDPGWEVTRPSGSSPATSPAPSAAGSDVPQPGWIRCSLTGRYFPPSEIIYLEGRPYSAAAKPQVVASLQGGSLLPTSDIGREGPAWENRDQLGMMKAILETVKAVLLEPTRAFATMKREGGLQNPLIFNLIVGTAAGIFVQIIASGMQMVLPGLLNPTGSGAGAAVAAGATGFIFGVIMVPVQVVIGSFLVAAVVHLFLMMLKGAAQPFETTFRVICYAYGGLAALNFIPIIGWLAAVPWSLVVLIIGLARAHEISTGKAALSVILPIVICGCLFSLAIAGFMSMVAGQMR